MSEVKLEMIFPYEGCSCLASPASTFSGVGGVCPAGYQRSITGVAMVTVQQTLGRQVSH